MSEESDRVDWLAEWIEGYKHYPETFGDDWPRELAESLACRLWPWSKRSPKSALQYDEDGEVFY